VFAATQKLLAKKRTFTTQQHRTQRGTPLHYHLWHQLIQNSTQCTAIPRVKDCAWQAQTDLLRLYPHVVVQDDRNFLMANIDQLRHQMLTSLSARHSENSVEMAMNLWQSMAIEIMSIIGETGFSSLYARSVYLCRASFPWLAMANANTNSPGEHRFNELREHLESQTLRHAIAANQMLLITFTDLLAKLIGENITISILVSAWGIDATSIEETVPHLEEESGNE
jgi:hypothetical protein